MQYIGILALIVGAILLIAEGLLGFMQSNTILVIGLVLVVGGYLLHIFCGKKAIV